MKEKILLNKSYSWEDANDLERDISEVADKVADSQHNDEWEGEIKVTITYIK